MRKGQKLLTQVGWILMARANSKPGIIVFPENIYDYVYRISDKEFDEIINN